MVLLRHITNFYAFSSLNTKLSRLIFVQRSKKIWKKVYKLLLVYINMANKVSQFIRSLCKGEKSRYKSYSWGKF